MKEFEIWIEGYAVTGNDGTAMLRGKYKGETFDDAMEAYMRDHPNTVEVYGSPSGKIYTDWARRFYDNEADARKSFG